MPPLRQYFSPLPQAYLLALEQAQEELDPTLHMKRVLAEAGMGTTQDQIAKPLGKGLWRLHGKVMTEDELERQLALDAVAYERRRGLGRELGIY